MVSSFSFLRTPKIIFGPDKINDLFYYAPLYGKNLLLIIGGGSLSVSGLLDRIIKSLKNEGIKTYVEKIATEPSPSMWS